MHLEDAQLYLVLDSTVGAVAADYCRAAISGGVDVIHLPATLAATPDQVLEIRDVCRDEDALLVISDDSTTAVEVEADGLHLTASTASIGQARAAIGVDGIVGMSTQSRSDAMLGLEMGADYLLHWEGPLSPGSFAMLPGAAGHVLFAAGLQSVEDAERVVSQGVYRLCIEAKLLGSDNVTEQAAVYSRVLGRCM